MTRFRVHWRAGAGQSIQSETFETFSEADAHADDLEKLGCLSIGGWPQIPVQVVYKFGETNEYEVVAYSHW